MFESFYQFDENPFRLNPDEKFRYIHPNYLKAWSYLKYGLDHAEGFVMVTGAPGTGKTTLIQSMLSELTPSKYLQVTLVSNQLQAEELLRLLALEFGFKAGTYNKATLLTRIQKYVSEQHAVGRRAIIIIDEAQNLAPQALEELRLLSNLQVGNQSLFQIFLIGQEELRILILGPGMEQIEQRLVATFRIEAMNAAQTQGYIEHRLGVVGWLDDPTLNPSIYPLIYRFTQGIPRKINHILSRLLLHGALEEKHRLDQEDLWAVLDELTEEVHMLHDSSMDLEALWQESREQDEAAHAQVAQSDIAVQDPFKTEPLDAEKESTNDFQAPPGRTLEEQLSSEIHYPLDRGEDVNSVPDETSISRQRQMPADTELPEAQAKTASLPVSHEDPSSLNTEAKAAPEAPLITPAMHAALTPVPIRLPEADTPDRRDRLFSGLERFFHWAAYVVGVAVLAFVILLPQTNDLGNLWHDLKLQGLQMLGLTHRHQTDSPLSLALEANTIPRMEITSPDSANRPLFAQRQPNDSAHEAANDQPVPYGNRGNKQIDESPIERSVSKEKSPEKFKTRDHATGIQDLKVPESDTQLEQKELAIRQAAETTFARQLALQLNAIKRQADTYESEAEDPKTRESVTWLTARPDQSKTPPPIPLQTHQVYFKFNSTEISDKYIIILNSVLNILAREEKTRVEITGFTDLSGDPVYNKLLSLRRAKAVASYLADRGIPQGRIEITGGGALPAQSEVQTEGVKERVYKRRVDIKTFAIGERSNPRT